MRRCRRAGDFSVNVPLTGYLAAEGFEADLRHELGSVVLQEHGRLFLAAGEALPAAWAANIWHNVQQRQIASIGEAATHLRSLQRNWVSYAPEFHRRAQLIQARLPHVSGKPLVFGAPLPAQPLGTFSLLAADQLIFSAGCSSPVAHGIYEFQEDRIGPPSRAYLKLWEALTRFGELPQPGQSALDLGASPGGWTWVMASCGVKVTAIDKAPLADSVLAMPGVHWQQGSAFAVDPGGQSPVDWLLSDVICYPARLLGLVRRCIDAGLAPRMICTLKFQGETDHATASDFAAIPGSRLLHLSHNKHELTWLWARGDVAPTPG